jgi:hypothetical protein
MGEPIKCCCCEQQFSFTWTDTHGIAACLNCGMPYTIFHYEVVDGKSMRVDRPPSPAIMPEGIELAKKYWQEHHRRVFPGAYDMGILSGRGRSYSGASEEEMRLFHEWCKVNDPTPAQA